MHSIAARLSALAILSSSLCVAETWELGALGGFSWYHAAGISNATGSADADFKPGFAGGMIFGDNMYEHLGGEIRYMFRFGGPELESQGARVSARGFTNVIHYDFLFHATPNEAKIRPYVAAGAGIKVFSGPHDLFPNQPLSDFALISRVNQVEPLISVGTGVKYAIARSVQMRLDFHTYITPSPDRVFRTALGSDIHGWLYDFVPTLGFSYVF